MFNLNENKYIRIFLIFCIVWYSSVSIAMENIKQENKVEKEIVIEVQEQISDNFTKIDNIEFPLETIETGLKKGENFEIKKDAPDVKVVIDIEKINKKDNLCSFGNKKEEKLNEIEKNVKAKGFDIAKKICKDCLINVIKYCNKKRIFRMMGASKGVRDLILDEFCVVIDISKPYKKTCLDCLFVCLGEKCVYKTVDVSEIFEKKDKEIKDKYSKSGRVIKIIFYNKNDFLTRDSAEKECFSEYDCKNFILKNRFERFNGIKESLDNIRIACQCLIICPVVCFGSIGCFLDLMCINRRVSKSTREFLRKLNPCISCEKFLFSLVIPPIRG